MYSEVPHRVRALSKSPISLAGTGRREEGERKEKEEVRKKEGGEEEGRGEVTGRGDKVREDDLGGRRKERRGKRKREKR